MRSIDCRISSARSLSLRGKFFVSGRPYLIISPIFSLSRNGSYVPSFGLSFCISLFFLTLLTQGGAFVSSCVSTLYSAYLSRYRSTDSESGICVQCYPIKAARPPMWSRALERALSSVESNTPASAPLLQEPPRIRQRSACELSA